MQKEYQATRAKLRADKRPESEMTQLFRREIDIEMKLFATAEHKSKVGAFQGMPYLVTSLGAFCSAARADEVTAFFAAHPAPEAARALRQATERITACAAVDARQSPALSRWLARAESEK